MVRPRGEPLNFNYGRDNPEFGIEAARVVLGHSSADVTRIYSELDLAKAAEIMGRVG